MTTYAQRSLWEEIADAEHERLSDADQGEPYPYTDLMSRYRLSRDTAARVYAELRRRKVIIRVSRCPGDGHITTGRGKEADRHRSAARRPTTGQPIRWTHTCRSCGGGVRPRKNTAEPPEGWLCSYCKRDLAATPRNPAHSTGARP